MTASAARSPVPPLGPLEHALCRSALWEALAIGFRPPCAETLERIATADGARGLRAAAAVLDRSAGVAPDGALLDRVVALVTAAQTLAHVTEDHRRLFGHAVRSDAPPYESEYGAGQLFRQPQELADVAGFYAAFGLVVAPDGGERVDHVSCELEFLAFLARKEAFALERGDAAMAEQCRAATRLFLRDHVGRFVPSFAERLCRACPSGLYPALGALADAFVRRECAAMGVTPGARSLAIRERIDDGVPMACGSCPLGTPGEDGDRAP